MSFFYEKDAVIADFYLLGQVRKSGAYVVLAWCHAPVQEWRILRYSMIKDLEYIGSIDFFRPDFNPYHPDIATIDTQAYAVRRRDN